MKPDLHALLLQAKSPHALSEVIFWYCSPAEGIQRIDFLCGKQTADWEMTCFIEARSQAEAHRLANHLNARVFGDRCVFLAMPLARDFTCESYFADSRVGSSPPVSCKCSW